MSYSNSNEVTEFTNRHWPELGGLESVVYQVVDRLPFNSQMAAMCWAGKVLIRREWLESHTHNGVVDMSAVSVLVWHEPCHIIEQRKRSWPAYLARYLWQWLAAGFRYHRIAEEKAAYANQARLEKLWHETYGAPTVGLF